MNKTLIGKHIDSITKIFNDARTRSFMNLPRLVLTLNYLSVGKFGATIDFHSAKNGHTLFSIKESTFMLIYPPENMQIKILCRHRESYTWSSEMVLDARPVETLIKFIEDRVSNPPSPLS